jgi:hypothetical protein
LEKLENGCLHPFNIHVRTKAMLYNLLNILSHLFYIISNFIGNAIHV